MLTRSAKRQARHKLSPALYASYQQLQLPWLCPALHGLVPHQPRRRISTPSSTSATNSASRNASAASQTRPLATVAEAVSSNPDDISIPFVDLTPGQRVSRRAGDLTRPRVYDTDNGIVVLRLREEPLPMFRKYPMGGMSGDVADLVANLHACAQIGQFGRAARVVKRLSGKVYESTAPQLADAHVVYLTGLLDALEREGRKDRFEEMRRWFDQEVLKKDVPPTPEMLSVMLKGAFAGEEEQRVDRRLRYYISLAKDFTKEDQYKMLSSKLFTAEEFKHVTSMTPGFNRSPQDIETAVAPSSPIHPVDVSSIEDPNETEGDSRTRENLPEIMAAEKGQNSLELLHQSLISMYKINEDMVHSSTSREYLNRLRQQRLEQDVRAAAIKRWETEAQEFAKNMAIDAEHRARLGPYMYEWMQEMAKHIKEEIELSSELELKAPGTITHEDHERLEIGPILRGLRPDVEGEEPLVKPERLAAAALMAWVASITDFSRHTRSEFISGRNVYSVAQAVGEAIKTEIKVAEKQVKSSALKKLRALPVKERRQQLRRLGVISSSRSAEAAAAEIDPELDEESELVENAGRHDNAVDEAMPRQYVYRVGVWFTALILKIAKLRVEQVDPDTGVKHSAYQPAATHMYRWIQGKRTGYIKPHDNLVKRLSEESVGGFISKPLPMLCEPIKWTGISKGGYLRDDPAAARIDAVRFVDRSKTQKLYTREADRQGHLTRLYEGLNVLSGVPWRVNRSVLKVLIEAWNAGEPIGKLAPAAAKEYVESKPGNLQDPSLIVDRVSRRRYHQMNTLIQNEIASYQSIRAYQNFQLEVARAFADEDAFYTPHNVDFRGRAYPIPPYFNHMGGDFVRSQFLFAQGKPLGQAGLRWLKIHLANMYGFDKEKLDDREEFAEQHQSEIFDSVNDPLGGKRWWLTASKPWQCLAACFELQAAWDSPVPEEYLSRLPIQVDGTCNGLQHYAALGGDEAGAAQVNLAPGDKPADIYSAVKDIVVAEVHKAAEEGHPLAKVLDGKITRKVVKQPVMTNVYGVTYHGAREQVKKQLIDILPKSDLGTDVQVNFNRLAAYIAKNIFSALGKMFTGAQAIQVWLGESGARISQSVNPDQIEKIIKKRAEPESGAGKTKYKRQLRKDVELALEREDYQFAAPIIWTTPIGMPVVQPYRASRTKTIKSSLQELTFDVPTVSDPVSKRKQLQAFPPNFIHSLDSSHMMLSAIRSHKHGLTFASVHDSFWTHGGDVDQMNEILRQAFIEMHSEDIIGRLKEEMEKRYAGFLFRASIERDSPLGAKISQLRKDSGKGTGRWMEEATISHDQQIDELVEEYERQRLLKSEDPEERQKGQEMQTPAKLFEEEGEAEMLPVLESNEVQLLGSQDSGAANVRMAKEAAEDEDIPGSEGAEDLAEADEAIASESDPNASIAESDTIEDDVEAAEVQEADEAVDGDVPTAPIEELKGEAKKKRRSTRPSKLYFWMPLKIPDAPEKGGFDVRQLKDSTYFFS